MTTVESIAIDRRKARSLRTRANISAALLHLLEEGHHQPCAQQVAKRANTSVRALFHHFGTMEGLYTEVVGTQTQIIIGRLIVEPTRLSTMNKAQRIVAQHDDLYSLAAPLHNCVRFNATVRSWTKVGESLQQFRQASSTQIQQSFADEISRQRNPYDAVCRLEAVTSFEMWDHFRRVQGCSRQATRTHILTLLVDVLEA